MNILLVRPKPHKESINLHSMMICEPLELEYLAARVEQLGHHADIVDLILEKMSLEYFLAQKKYDIVGFTAYLTHVGIVKDLSERAHTFDPNMVTLVGGVHAEVNPDDFDDPRIDLVVHGNAMTSMKPLLTSLEEADLSDSEGRAKAFDNIRSTIPGVWQRGKARPPFETNFPFPFPDRSKTRKYRNKYSYSYLSRCASIKTSYGCPYDCNFCFCTCITQNNYFERDLREVIEEIKTIEEPNFYVVDDNFLLRRKRVLEFCRLMEEENIKKTFILFGRADFVVKNPDVMERLRDVGLHAVFVGIESFSENDLTSIGKNSSVAMNVKAIETIESLGMNCYCGLIAMPDWDRSDFDNVINFLGRFKNPIINLQPLTPLPGTVCYEQYKSQLVVPRERYEVWDLAHLMIKPLKMAPSDFYRNILRVYYKTSTGLHMHWYILHKYSLEAYFRTFRGVITITGQYFKMIRDSRA
ncbi:MAG: radical SAM protein [Betaproteobacteria bacterium]|nr:radical SAM protein [Betaproteobacteria bacterium]